MPFLVPIGTALGVGGGGLAAGLAGGAALAATGAGVYSALNSVNQGKQAKKDAADAAARNAAAIQSVKDSQSQASDKAQQMLNMRRRSGSQTVFTNPLGVSTQASTAKKVLLGQ